MPCIGGCRGDLRLPSSGVHLPSLPAHPSSPPAIENTEPENSRQEQGIQRIEQTVGGRVAVAGAEEHRGGGSGGPQEDGLHPATGERETRQGGGREESDGERR